MLRWHMAKLMTDRGYTSGTLAGVLPSHPHEVTVRRWRASKSMPPIRPETLEDLCRVLDCQPGELITYEP